ncbi:MAG: hypothetical protein ACRDZ4_04460 [Egibacteraceae bacterium]
MRPSAANWISSYWRDLDEEYAAAMEKILVANSPEVQVLTADLSVRELGGLVGAKRAGCVGLMRGRTLPTLLRQVDIEAASSHPCPACPHR